MRLPSALFATLVLSACTPADHGENADLSFEPAAHAGEHLDRIVIDGAKWEYSVRYPSGDVALRLYLPVGRPVLLEIRSADDDRRFRIDGTPLDADTHRGAPVVRRVLARRVGTHRMSCAGGDCGPRSDRHGFQELAKFLEPADYDAAVAALGRPPTGETPAAWGATLFTEQACGTCHDLAGVGGHLRGLLGSDTTFTDGTTLHLDDAHFDAYVAESLAHPDAKIVRGSERTPMPEYHLSAGRTAALVAYLRCRGANDCPARPTCTGACD